MPEPFDIPTADTSGAAEAEQLLEAARYTEALACYQELLKTNPDRSIFWANAGSCLASMRRHPSAIAAYRRALALEPGKPSYHINIALSLYRLGQGDAAANHLEKAIELSDHPAAHMSLAIMAPGVPGYDLARVLLVRAAFAKAHAADAEASNPCPVRTPAAGPCCIAYLSAHFHQPEYMGPVWAALNNHDRSRFRLVLLADGDAIPPFHAYQIHPEDTCVNVALMDNRTLRARLRELGVDILIDLSGYSYPPRLDLYLQRAAPVVASWFNMYSTSGLPGIDYLIGDEHVVLPHEEVHYSETVLRLPQSYLSFLPYAGRPPVQPPPCTLGVPFTFGSLVSMYKLTAPVLDVWSEVLRRANETRLLLANSELDIEEIRAHLLEQFATRGIEPGRIVLRGPAPHDAFLRYYDEMDLALDSFPYSGGTTTMEAIWQGVPVLTQAGEGWAARTTGSILADTHLSEFQCADVASYIERATTMALDPASPERLAALRRTMRPDLLKSRALDGPALARGLEALYEEMLAQAASEQK